VYFVSMGVYSLLGFDLKSLQNLSHACIPLPNFLNHVIHLWMAPWVAFINVHVKPWIDILSFMNHIGTPLKVHAQNTSHEMGLAWLSIAWYNKTQSIFLVLQVEPLIFYISVYFLNSCKLVQILLQFRNLSCIIFVCHLKQPNSNMFHLPIVWDKVSMVKIHFQLGL
jgi:hypothetical protein